MNETEKKDYITNIYLNLHKNTEFSNRYMLPFSTGQYFVYHFNRALYGAPAPAPDTNPTYIITLPQRFTIDLQYVIGKVNLKKYCSFYYEDYYNISQTVKLSDYFQCEIFQGDEVPIGLNKIGIENKVKQAIKLAAFL